MGRAALCAMLSPGIGLLCAACAPTRLRERPAEWPEFVGPRRLYNTPGAFIYARKPDSAGEAERLITAIADQFTCDTDAAPGKGLVLVTDADDPLILEDRELLFELIAWADVLHHDDPDDQAQAKRKAIDEQEKELDVLGLPPELILRTVAASLPREDVATHLKLPTLDPDAVRWIATLPTRNACRVAAHELTGAALKQEEISFAQRLMIAPLLPFVESLAANKLAEERDFVLYASYSTGMRDWAPARKREVIDRYRAKKDSDFADRLAADTRLGRADSENLQVLSQTTPPMEENRSVRDRVGD
jgi:hypothetical protein